MDVIGKSSGCKFIALSGFAFCCKQFIIRRRCKPPPRTNGVDHFKSPQVTKMWSPEDIAVSVKLRTGIFLLVNTRSDGRWSWSPLRTWKTHIELDVCRATYECHLWATFHTGRQKPAENASIQLHKVALQLLSYYGSNWFHCAFSYFEDSLISQICQYEDGGVRHFVSLRISNFNALSGLNNKNIITLLATHTKTRSDNWRITLLGNIQTAW